MTRIAEAELWDNIEQISTVSGGTLCTALVFCTSGNTWPDGDTFLSTCNPKIHQLLTTIDIQARYLFCIVLKPWQLLQGRAHVLAGLIKKHWGIAGNVSDMPRNPCWTINGTCYETGKNWRFTAKRMGDYVANYVIEPRFPLADAVATSAAVPGAIGPLKLKTKKYNWHRYNQQKKPQPADPIVKALTLWDGGVYDNLGVEALYKISKGLQKGIGFLLVSDASKYLGIKDRKWFYNIPLPRSLTRLVDIPTDQVRSVRSRDLFPFFEENRNGGYLRMGETVPVIFENWGMSVDFDPTQFMTESAVQEVSLFPTTLKKLTSNEFKLIYRHGYEVCSALLAVTGTGEYISFDGGKYPWLE
jgi:NTE family protein